MKSKVLEHNYTVERIKVSDLEVDTRVQRDALQMGKVDKIVRDYNRDAVGVIHVSRRLTENGSLVGHYIIDGAHRTEATRRVTENVGEMVCHVFEGLTLEQEAQMFLDLNYGNQPSPLEKHKNRVVAQDPQALRVEEGVHKYGWAVSKDPANGHVNCIMKLYAIDALSEKIEADPDLISMTFLVITRAWGNDRRGAQAVILEGIARLIAEHGSKINFDHLIDRLKVYPGGPGDLRTESARFASLTKGKVAMSVANLITEWYNKGKGERKSALPPWRKRA
jgi:uncharacterized protein DUF6551